MIDAGKGLFKAKGRLIKPEPLASRLPRRSTMDQMNKFGEDSMDVALNSFGGWSKNAQAIASEVADYSKKSFEDTVAAWEKLIGAKSLEKAMEVQSEYLKSSYEDFIAQSTKLGELYVDLAKEAYKPFEGVVAKAAAMK
jgi:phasin family protein